MQNRGLQLYTFAGRLIAGVFYIRVIGVNGRRFVAGCAACLLMFCGASCKKESGTGSEPSQPAVQESQAETPVTGDAAVLIGNGWVVTMSEYDRCLNLTRLQEGPVTRRALANSSFQRREIQMCQQVEFMRMFLEKNGLRIEPKDHLDGMVKWTSKYDVADEKELAEKLGIPADQISDAVDDSMLVYVVQRKLVADLEDNQARQMYALDARTYSVEIGTFENEPTDAEVALYLGEHNSEFSQYLSLHKGLTESPPSVSFVRLGYRFVDADQRVNAQQNTDMLRRVAGTDGLDEAIRICRDHGKDGCEVFNDRANLLTELRNDENVWAFRSAVGQPSEVLELPDHFEIKVSTAILAPVKYDLNDPEIQKIVARKVIHEAVPVAHLMAGLKSALDDKEVTDFRAVVESLGGVYQSLSDTYENLSRSNALNARLVMLLKAVHPEEVGLFSTPFVYQGRLYVYRVTSMTPPAAGEFEVRQAEWRKRLETDPQFALTRLWIDKEMHELPTLNIRPVEEKYGVLQQNGEIK